MYVFPKISVGNYIHNSSHKKKKKTKKEANKTKQEKWDLTCE